MGGREKKSGKAMLSNLQDDRLSFPGNFGAMSSKFTTFSAAELRRNLQQRKLWPTSSGRSFSLRQRRFVAAAATWLLSCSPLRPFPVRQGPYSQTGFRGFHRLTADSDEKEEEKQEAMRRRLDFRRRRNSRRRCTEKTRRRRQRRRRRRQPRRSFAADCGAATAAAAVVFPDDHDVIGTPAVMQTSRFNSSNSLSNWENQINIKV